MFDDFQAQRPLGWVPVDHRGSLPFALVLGESLVAAASWALEAADVQLLDQGTSFEAVRRSGRPLVLHDPLCPLTPVSFLVEAIELAQRTGEVVIGRRPVTDTVKEVHGETLGMTVDRAGLIAVTSPVVLPAPVLAELTALPGTRFPELAAFLAGRTVVRFLESSAVGARIRAAEDLPVLEALSHAAA